MCSPELLLQAVYSRWASRHGVHLFLELFFHKPTDDKGSCTTHARAAWVDEDVGSCSDVTQLVVK
jgi:hypothetical protein